MGRPAKPLPGFGGLLRRLRLDRRFTQAELADEADVTPGYVARIELNQVSPSSALLLRLADALGVPVSALAEHGGYVPPELTAAYRQTPEALLWFCRLPAGERQRHAASAIADEDRATRDRVRRLARRIARGGW